MTGYRAIYAPNGVLEYSFTMRQLMSSVWVYTKGYKIDDGV